MFEDKYNLSLKENVFLAKKRLVQSIYIEAKIEGINVTFPQTQTILDGVTVAGLKTSDFEKIINLRDAWDYTIRTIEEPFSLDYMMKVNGYVARNESLEWGVLRTGKIGISGTEYMPKIPERAKVESGLQKITESGTATKQAIYLMLYAMRSQLFWDGNKRTSMIAANKYMIQKGVGIIQIPENKLSEFSERLTHFYDTNDYTAVDRFLYDSCIEGIEFPNRQKEQKPKKHDQEI